MVRGWSPAVEETLIERVGSPRATRLTLSYAGEFSDSYRTRTRPEEGAEDILRLAALDDPDDRGVRLFRRDTDESGPAPDQDLSSRRPDPAVRRRPGVRELRFPRARGNAERGRRRFAGLHPRLPARASRRSRHRRDPWPLPGNRSGDLERLQRRSGRRRVQPAGAVRRARHATGGLAPRRGSATCARPEARSASSRSSMRSGARPRRRWRWSSCSRASTILRPGAAGPRRPSSMRQQFDHALTAVRSIDDDRILRRLRALIEAILRTNAFAQKPDEALAFKINSSLVPGLPAAGAVARDLGLQPARRRHPPARRPDRPRRPALVGSARRLPHRDPRPDEGAAGQECRHRPDRREGRLLSQAAAAARPTAMPGSRKARKATGSSSARCCRSPTTSSTTRSSIPTTS